MDERRRIRSVERVDQKMPRLALEILDGEVTPELRMRMRQLPAQLRAAGLAAAYAAIAARATRTSDSGDAVGRNSPVQTAYRNLAEAIPRHIYSERLLDSPAEAGPDAPKAFLQALSRAETGNYLRVSAEVDVLALWLSRLATALYRGNGEGADRGEG